MAFSKIAAENLGGSNLPAIGGGNLTGLTSGLSMADQWRITSGYSGQSRPITSNWERADTSSYTVLGTGLTNSSGIFSFPSTGYYFIIYTATFVRSGDTRNVGVGMEYTVNNSAYADLAYSSTFIKQTESDATYTSCATHAIVDVTDTSNCKIRFFAGATDVTTTTDTNAQHHGFQVFKLGDT
tara:strand:- start:256 stop:804 length:549 start_codon:yes stop_codon:yes gene_type:complete